MKQLFPLAIALATMATFCQTAEAQSKKMWDFSFGVSDADRMNLDADATNWNKTANDAGVSQYWSDLTKLYGTISANGVPLEFLQDLTFSSTGLSKSNNFKLGPTAFRMTRNNMELHLPKLANGQTVTVLARSANSSATNRGIKGNENMTILEGPDGGICLGSQVEGSLGTYTYKWEVTTSEPDSVDVALIMITGGVDIQSIMIDNGDESSSETEEINIAYLYDSSYNGAKDADKNPCGWLANGGLEEDPVWATLGTYNATAIDYNGQALTSAELNDSLMKFDVVVAGEAVSSGNALAKGLLEIVNKVPMLNLKSFMYKKGVWTWGAGVNPSPKATALTIAEGFAEEPLFADLELAEDGTLPLFECDDVTALNGNLIQAYTASADLIANDEVLATVGGNLAIHRHGTKNQYLLIPISSDNMNMAHGNLYTLIDNAVKVLAATKSKVQQAAAPVVKQEAADGITYVTLSSSAPDNTIYYTLDGTEPTTASAVYADTIVVTADSTVLKAFAIAHGFNDSNVTKATIIVKTQAAAPSLSVEGLEGQTILTLNPAEGTIAYYSFNGVTNAAEAQTYTEPIILREPATLTYFAAGNGKLNSEIQQEEITVGGIPVVKDTLAHFTANEAEWFTAALLKDAEGNEQPTPDTNWAAKAAYYWGKSAWSYYGTEVEKEEVVTDSLGVAIKSLVNPEQDSIKVTYKADPAAVKFVYSSADTQWRLRSQGQVFTGECNVAPSYGVGNGATGYYAESATDLIGAPSKGKLTFGGKTGGDPYTASVESTVKFPAPFDVVTYLTNGGTGEPNLCLQTSVDGETWQTVGQLTNAKTQRYYKKDRFHVEGTDELYVRVAQVAGASKGQLYDIYVIATDGISGIETIATEPAQRDTRSYDLFGRQLQAPVRGQLFIQAGKKAILR